MQIKKIQDADVRGKKVLVRVDFNVSINEEDDAKSLYKIHSSRETIEYLIDHGASYIALLTHFGRPEKAKDKMQYTMEKLTDDVARVLDRPVAFVPDCVGSSVMSAMDGYAQGTVLLLENVRFYEEEKKDDASFAAQLCAPFDVYINDAFAVCHRKHASVHAITTCIPAYAGMRVQEELMYLHRVKQQPEHPAIAIIGGAKIDTKIPMITEFSQKYDAVLVGGRTAVEAIDRKMHFDDVVILPRDFAYKYFDIGPKTIERFVSLIAQAKTIVWNGPMGKIEDDAYKKGTFALIDAIAANENAFSLIGGGESVQLVEESGKKDRFSFVSTGGGAMLAYLGGESMPGIEVLKQ